MGEGNENPLSRSSQIAVNQLLSQPGPNQFNFPQPLNSTSTF